MLSGGRELLLRYLKVQRLAAAGADRVAVQQGLFVHHRGGAAGGAGHFVLHGAVVLSGLVVLGVFQSHLESHLAAGADGLTGVQIVLAHVDGLAAGRAGHLIIRLTGHVGVVVIVVCLGLVVGVVLFILGIFVSILICGWKGMMAGDFEHLYIFFFALIFGGIGFLDDFEKVKHKQNLGLTAIQKFLLQLAAAVAFLCLMRFEGMLTPNLYVPFFNTQIVMSWWVYMVFAAFVIVGTVNAVNITDGIDGLAGSVTVPVGLFFTVLAIWWQGYEQLGIYAAALVGGILGFLIYNFHPAKVFMGDTGSLFLGGMVCGLAFALDMPLVLIPVGIIYILETLSDIIQVGYFKATHGKRFFKMAPLHHHLERCGWSEVKLVAVFTSVSALCCLAALFGVLNRFHF